MQSSTSCQTLAWSVGQPLFVQLIPAALRVPQSFEVDRRHPFSIDVSDRLRFELGYASQAPALEGDLDQTKTESPQADKTRKTLLRSEKFVKQLPGFPDRNGVF
jgi:hypothetical protein